MKRLAILTVVLAVAACGGDGGNQDEGTEPDEGAPTLPWHLARSADGDYLCEIVRVLPGTGPDDPAEVIVGLEFAFPEVPSKTILDQEVRVPRAIRPDGENYAGPWMVTPLMPTPNGLALPELRLGPGVDRVSLLQLDAIAARVLDSKEFVFTDLGPGKSDMLRCRAFELVVTGEEKCCKVLVQAFVEFAEEHAEHHMDVPPTVTTHEWGLRTLTVTDSTGRRLVQRGGAGGLEMSMGEFFATGPGGEEILPISYPVTVKIEIPTKVRMENVIFRFKNVPAAPYEKQ